MKYLLFASAIILSCLSGKSQPQAPFPISDYASTDNYGVVSGVNGIASFNTDLDNLKSGTPFFNDQWMKGELIDAAHKVYAAHAVRINLLSNQVDFLDAASGQEMVVADPIRWIRLTDSVKGTQYMFVLGNQLSAPKTQAGIWFQVLVNDKISLCRQMRKTVHGSMVYGEGKVTTISTDDIYYLFRDGSLIALTGWGNLQDQLNDKKDALGKYIHDHHLKGRAPGDYTELVGYYNTLPNS